MIEYKNIGNNLEFVTKRVPQNCGNIEMQINVDNYTGDCLYFLELLCPENKKYVSSELVFEGKTATLLLPISVVSEVGEVYGQLVMREKNGALLSKSFMGKEPFFIVDQSVNASENFPSNPGEDLVGDIVNKIDELTQISGTLQTKLDNGEFKGAKGDKGDRGVQGPQGIKGETGAVGPKGDKGLTGPQGLKGETGAVGPKGDKGETGAVGPKGDKGETGAIGPQGDKGETGAVGPKGDRGLTGPQGPKGDTGKQGIQGPKGDKGETQDISGKANLSGGNTFSGNQVIKDGELTVTGNAYLRYSVYTGALHRAGVVRTQMKPTADKPINLNDINLASTISDEIYYQYPVNGGSKYISNRPNTTEEAFILDVKRIRQVNANDYVTLQFYVGIKDVFNFYYRKCANGSWTQWFKIPRPSELAAKQDKLTTTQINNINAVPNKADKVQLLYSGNANQNVKVVSMSNYSFLLIEIDCNADKLCGMMKVSSGKAMLGGIGSDGKGLPQANIYRSGDNLVFSQVGYARFESNGDVRWQNRKGDAKWGITAVYGVQ